MNNATQLATTIEGMAMGYGASTKNGTYLLSLASLCESETANFNAATLEISGPIPTYSANGTDFSGEKLAAKLRGLNFLFPESITVMTTHDLFSYRIKHLGNLVTSIRLEA